jgi:hypothetical protein
MLSSILATAVQPAILKSDGEIRADDALLYFRAANT